jgi:hypothetical protein
VGDGRRVLRRVHLCLQAFLARPAKAELLSRLPSPILLLTASCACCHPSSLPTPAGGGGSGDEEGGDDGVTPQQKKSKTRNDKRLEQKQARAKEAAAASKKKFNKLMEVGADLKTWWRVAGGGWLIEQWGRLCGASASVPFADGRCQPPINSCLPLCPCPPARLPACCRRLRPRAA